MFKFSADLFLYKNDSKCYFRTIKSRLCYWTQSTRNETLSSLLGLSIGHLLGGTAIIETIFSYQGLGNMVVEAIRYRDYPIIQAYAIYMALIYVFVNLFVDIFQQVLNPRLRRRFNEKKVKN